jgi:outer membrane lipoprotein-sorting protein
MKKAYFILSVLLASSIMTVNAQNLKSILKKHYSAVGQTAINQAQAVVITGQISQMGMELPFALTQKRPGKARFEATFQEMKLIQAYDGKKGWAINPMSGPDPIDMGVSEAKSMERIADIEGSLYNWKKKGYKASYEGTEDFNGESTYKIKVILSEDETETYFINATTYLISKVDSKAKVEGLDVESTKILSDYREVQSYKLAFKTETIMMGEAAGEMIITGFEIKKPEEVSDELFVRPAK